MYMHLLLEIKGRLGCGELNIDLMMLNTSRLCATDVDKRNVLFFTDGKKAKRPFLPLPYGHAGIRHICTACAPAPSAKTRRER